MEKLEAALAKARELRKTALGSTPGTPREKQSAGVAAPVDWSDLPEIEIAPERARRNRISALLGGVDATPYDMLRSRTIRQMKDKGWRRLAITSPGAACGKTTISINLALSLSRQKDLKVMLIDLDVRRPSINKQLNYQPKHSFHEVLEGKARFEDQAVRIGDNLIVATNNSASRHPSELLQSVATREAPLSELVGFEPKVFGVEDAGRR